MMSDIQSRVTACFLTVFPDLAEGDVRWASQASLSQWDSVAQVVLLSAIAEEFEIALDNESLETATNYSQIVDFVEKRVRS